MEVFSDIFQKKVQSNLPDGGRKAFLEEFFKAFVVKVTNST